MWLQLLLSVVAVILTRRVWRRWKYDMHKIPSPPGLPVLGHTVDFFYGLAGKDLTKWLADSYKKLGFPKLMRVNVLGSPWLFVSDLECTKSVVMSKTDPFPKNELLMPLFFPMAGADPNTKLFFTTCNQTPYVKAVRKMFANGFQSSNLRKALPSVKGIVDQVVDIVESKRGNGHIEMQDLCLGLALDVAGRFMFETNLGGLDGSRRIHEFLHEVCRIVHKRYANPLNGLYAHLFPYNQKIRQENAIIDGLSKEYRKLAEEILERKDPPNGEVPVWYALKTLVDPETGQVIPFNTLRGEIGGAILGGTDTTGHQLGWMLALLASHPAVTNKILEELKDHGLYGPGSRDFTFEDLGELVYLNATIKEGMRIAYVFFGSVPRTVPRDVELLGYRVPKGTFLIVSSNRCADSEAEWGDPHTFRPERWLEEDLSGRFYFAFSIGPRDCQGRGLALMEMKTAIIKLLSRYELGLKGTFEELMATSRDAMSVEAGDGIWIQFTPRD